MFLRQLFGLIQSGVVVGLHHNGLHLVGACLQYAQGGVFSINKVLVMHDGGLWGWFGAWHDQAFFVKDNGVEVNVLRCAQMVSWDFL